MVPAKPSRRLQQRSPIQRHSFVKKLPHRQSRQWRRRPATPSLRQTSFENLQELQSKRSESKSELAPPKPNQSLDITVRTILKRVSHKPQPTIKYQRNSCVEIWHAFSRRRKAWGSEYAISSRSQLPTSGRSLPKCIKKEPGSSRAMRLESPSKWKFLSSTSNFALNRWLKSWKIYLFYHCTHQSIESNHIHSFHPKQIPHVNFLPPVFHLETQ